MNFTSQICTTKEQSKRLLALGLKKETADMCIRIDLANPIAIPYNEVDEFYYKIVIPAWSLHRLIEIASIMAFSPVSSINGWYDDIIAQIQSLIHIKYIDEKYLNMDIVNARENENVELLKNGAK